MTTKNPFELRADILAMAKDYMDQQYHMNMDFARQAFETALAAGKATQDEWQKFVVPAYSIKELTEKAQELYGFVSSK